MSLVDSCGAQCSMRGSRTKNKHGLREIVVVSQPGHDGRVAQGRRGSAGAFHCLAVPRQDKVAAPRCTFWWHLEHNGLRDTKCPCFLA